MAGELHHIDPGDSLGYVEYQGTTIHNLDGQAAGDIIIARSATVLERLALGTGVLRSNGTTISWDGTTRAASDTLGSGTFSATSWTDTGLEVSITPSSTTSVMMLIASGGAVEVIDQDDIVEIRFVRGTTGVGTAFWYLDDASPSSGVAMNYMCVDHPNSTDSQTYKVQVRCTGGSASYKVSTVFGTPASFVVMEII